MRISKRTMTEIANRFDAVLDYITELDEVPFDVKRKAADRAAAEAVSVFQDWKRKKKTMRRAA